MKSTLLALTFLPSLLVAGTSNPGKTAIGEPPRVSPADMWSFDAETSSLWRISHNTTANYTVLPQIFSLRSPAFIHWNVFGHQLTVRNRLSVLVEPIAKGPESLYLGVTGSPSLEYWFLKDKACWYTSVGGGLGWIDSGDEVGGQGRDLTFNWFATMGVRFYFTPTTSVNAGAYFQHMSNGGATDPNPGLDALGPILGFSWAF